MPSCGLEAVHLHAYGCMHGDRVCCPGGIHPTERQRTMRSKVENVNMEQELHGARFSKLQKIQNLNFGKIQKKYQSVVYNLFYQCVKFYYKISYILSSAKIIKI
jgi:hypothetical protein